MTGFEFPKGTEGTEGTEITGQDQHGDTEVRRGSRFGIQDSCNPVLKNRNIEILSAIRPGTEPTPRTSSAAHGGQEQPARSI